MARGIQPNGEVVFYAWGRNDMKQYITSYETTNTQNNHSNIHYHRCHVPSLLKPLPAGHTIADAWCGSEFTIVVDECGYLWGCGWNEHGNIGIGCTKGGSLDDNICNEWFQVQKIIDYEDQPADSTSQIKTNPLQVHLWEGSVACGGGHAIALSK